LHTFVLYILLCIAKAQFCGTFCDVILLSINTDTHTHGQAHKPELEAWAVSRWKRWRITWSEQDSL